MVAVDKGDYEAAAEYLDLRNIYGEILFDDSERSDIDDFIAPEIWRYLD